MPTGRLYFIAGDGYPGDIAVEDAVCARIPMLRRQREWLGVPKTGQFDLETRIERAARRLDPSGAAGGSDASGGSGGAVLIGRSSGARAATLLAGRCSLRAVICLGYPFQPPYQEAQEPERFSHLARIETPTLIIQGTADEYGAADITERFDFSPAVQVRLVAGACHGMELSAAGWDRVVDMIADFVTAAPAAPDVEGFDEADYLRRYPDVAVAVRDGRVASGKAHFVERGRAEGRRYRLVPIDLEV